jgi:hypothetical protein
MSSSLGMGCHNLFRFGHDKRFFSRGEVLCASSQVILGHFEDLLVGISKYSNSSQMREERRKLPKLE